MAEWTRVWHQAMTRSFAEGRAFGGNRTIAFAVETPVSGGRMRLAFSNYFGKAPYPIDDMVVRSGRLSVPVTVGGRTSFEIPCGELTYSDELEASVTAGGFIEVRMHHPKPIVDCNIIEEQATLLRGNQVAGSERGMHKPLLARVLGAYNAIPAIHAIEVLSDAPAKAIVAFGDSITALSQWTRPLAARLQTAYPGEYALLNSGISGNCLLCEVEGAFGPVSGQRGTERFGRDVLDVPNLGTVIFGLGVNDASFYSEKTRDVINRDAFAGVITRQVDQLRDRGVRVVIQTITPRLGAAWTMGKFTPPMEEQRLLFNEWIRTAGIFDYVFDAEAVVADRREDGLYYREGLHQGDHLHPNAEGGRLLAESFDLEALTGRAPGL